MRAEKETLKNLLDNVNYYRNSINLHKKLDNANLIRYYISGYFFFRKKFENSKTNETRIKYQKLYKNFWNLYYNKIELPNRHTKSLKNNDIYDFM